MNSLNDVIKNNLCLGCGLCNLNISDEDSKVNLKYSDKKGHNIPYISDLNSINHRSAFEFCPGKGYNINSLAKNHIKGDGFEFELGYYDELNIITNNEISSKRNASSSGITTLIIKYLLENNIVDKAVVTKFEYSETGPHAKTFSTNNYLEVVEAQGSKYCPVDLQEIITELKNDGDNTSYVYVGAPCQVASLRYIQQNIRNLGIKYFIGNFCGGFKSYNNLKRLQRLNNVKADEITFFRYRGGGQPGSMQIKTDNKVVEIPYPEYVKMTGYSKLKRCHLCVDATAELADFSCGDAWLPQYMESEEPTSIVITRNPHATKIMAELAQKQLINRYPISVDEIIKSQRGNIRSKKYRQKARLSLYKTLGINSPILKEGFSGERTSIWFEINVFISHKVKFLFEKAGLFYLFYYKSNFIRRVMFRIFKDNYN